MSDTNSNTYIDYSKDNAIFKAIDENDIDSVKFLLSIKHDLISTTNKNGEAPLMYAISQGYTKIDIIHLLIGFGGSIFQKDHNNICSIERLVESILFVNKKYKSPNLCLTKVDRENGDYFKLLADVLSRVKPGKLNEYFDSEGNPYFFKALLYNDILLFSLLKRFGAKINTPNVSGLNIIFYFIEKIAEAKEHQDKRKFFQVLENLVYHGINVNAQDKIGVTPLHHAVRKDCTQTISILMKGKIDYQVLDFFGRGIIHNCVWSGNVQNMKSFYFKDKETLNIVDKFGFTPLNYAVFKGDITLVLEMLKMGAYVNNPSKKNLTIVAFLSKHLKAIDSLHKKAQNKHEEELVLRLTRNMKREIAPFAKQVLLQSQSQSAAT